MKWYTTKRCITFNKYARNFNFHNEMKATITRSHSHVALCLPQLHETPGMHIYIMKSITRKRCILHYTRNCGSTKKWNLAPHKNGCPTINVLHNSVVALHLHPTTRSMVSTIWNSRPVIGPCRNQGDHVTCKCCDTCCQRQKILASRSSRWYM